MEKTKTNKTVTATRAEKKDAAKALIREALAKKEYKPNDLIEEAAKLYVERFESETDNINDVKGRIGSVLDIMKKEQEVQYEGGMYALTAEKAQPVAEEKPVKKTARKTKKAEAEKVAEAPETKTVKKATKSKKTTAKKSETDEKESEKTQPLPAAPIQPIAPVAPITPEVAPEPIPEEKPKKKRATKSKAVETKLEEKTENQAPVSALSEGTPFISEKEKTFEIPEKAEEKQEEIKEEKQESTALTTKEKGEVAPKGTVMDMSFLFGEPKSAKPQVKAEQKEEVKEIKAEEKKELPERQEKLVKATVKAVEPKKQEKATQQAKAKEVVDTNKRKVVLKAPKKAVTAEEKLKEAYLKRIRSLGGNYFEYYSVYLLEKYSRRNGRRLESLRIAAGDRDGGIDGEIELTDKLGFRETIYIQAKNWNPEKGDEKLWVVGETLLQQFIGACACRQARDGKQHCRGIFMTTSRFTPEAKRILENMSDKIVGYDGEDLFEAAKESEFGLIKKNGEWALDEALLSGEKAFFRML